MNIENVLSWISDHESVLSGIAAAIVIGSVFLALFERVSRPLRGRRQGASASTAPDPGDPPLPNLKQEIRFCQTPDDVRLAYASVGSGPPLVRALGWFTHLELEWQNQTSRFFWERLARKHRVVRYDGRGMGLSERDIEGFSLETRLLDLETVVDAAGLDRFALMGLSEGGTTAIAYAAKHPERVSHLILWGTFLNATTRADLDQWRSMAALIPENWGTDSQSFHQLFVGMFLPEGRTEQNELFREMQRRSTSGESALKVILSIGEIDVTEQAAQVQSPTLVMHLKGDLVIPAAEGQAVAARIPGARLELIDGSNHWVWIREDSTEESITMIEEFLESP